MTPQRNRVSRRRYLATVGATTAVATALAGCLDDVPFIGNSPLGFAAHPASVPASALQATGYEQTKQDEFVVSRTYEVAGQSQEVEVTNSLSEYAKEIDLGVLDTITGQTFEAAVFIALSTPQVDVLGQTFNPVGEKTAAELAEMVQDHYDDMGSLDQVDETTAPVAGEPTTVGEFETEAELLTADMTVDLTLHIAEAVPKGDDFIVAIGGYPSELAPEEAPNVFSLMEAVEHDQ